MELVKVSKFPKRSATRIDRETLVPAVTLIESIVTEEKRPLGVTGTTVMLYIKLLGIPDPIKIALPTLSNLPKLIV